MSAEDQTTERPSRPQTPRKRPRGRRAALWLIAAVLALAAALVGARLAGRSAAVLDFVEARLDGAKAGRYGRLQVEGLEGDLWRKLSLRRLAIVDARGVWLEVKDVEASWRPAALVGRVVAVEALSAAEVHVLRRPIRTARTPSKGLPVAVRIARLKTRIATEPAFSYRRAAYDVTGALELRRRKGGQKGRVAAVSRLRAGDHLNAVFDIGRGRPLLVTIDAEEAEGGGLAGALGLPADQPFKMEVDARGRVSAGRFKALAISGAITPLEAEGAWSEQGGQANGRILLGASELTRGLAGRVGEEVGFMAYGRKTPGELYALDGRLTAANLTVTARGQGDLGKRRTGPAGIAVTLLAPDLSRLAGPKGLGAARIDGVLRGDARDVRFAGETQVLGIEAQGYRLSRVSGPVELLQREDALTLSLKLAGAGGAGAGLAAALLGETPQVRMEARRLEDGRLLLRSLEAEGSGLTVEASGGRTLLGGLTFKGRAGVRNLESARAGAGGALKAQWSADQDRAGRPWSFSLDAEGEALALGVSELDRLLGGAPTLRARAELAGRKLTVAEARIDGAALRAEAKGVLAETGGLDFTLDWSAEGPFRAGPIEVSGKAAGRGVIAGDLAAPRAELAADFDEIDAPRLPLRDAHLDLTFARGADGSSGRAALTAASDHGPANAATDFAFPKGGLDLTDLSLDAGGLKASGSVSLRRRAPSAANLEVEVGQGAFLEAGAIAGEVKVVDAAGGARATLRLSAQNAVLPGRRLAIREGRLTADGPLAHLPYVAAAEGSSRRGRWALDGRGAYSNADPGAEITFEGTGRLGQRRLRTVEPARLVMGDGRRVAELHLTGSEGGRLDLDALMADGAANVKLTAAGVDMGLLNEDLAGRVDAELSLQGRGERLEGRLDARLTGARGRGADASTGVNGTLRASLDDASLTLRAEGANAQGLKADADLVLPAEASAAPFRVAIARKRPVQGRFFAEGEVRPLWDLLTNGERALSGHVRLQGELGGTLADLQATGSAAVSGGRFLDGASGLALRNVALKAELDGTTVNVTEASGDDGHGGRLNGEGRITLRRDGASTFRLDLDRFRLIDNDRATAAASGQATIDRAADGKMRLAGDLTVDEAEIAADPPTPSGVVVMEVVERNKPVDLDASLAAPVVNGPGMALNMLLKAPRGVFLRGRGLDIEFALDAHVTGTTSRPVLSGDARVVRGDYDFAGKRFEFDPRGVVNLATQARAIRLNLTATRSDASLVAVVRIRGTAAKPEITLTSTPVLPNDEVLSQVLFGRSASQLSPLEAAQLASALSALAGGGGFDVIGGLRTFAGLDRLAVGGGGESALSVSGGKYLTDDVYLELTGGGRDGASAQVEWRVRDNLSIISRLGGQGAAKLAVRWRKDY